MSVSELKALIQTFLAFVEGATGADPRSERTLDGLLVQLAAAAQEPQLPGPLTSAEAPRRDYRGQREIIAARFPNYGLYRMASSESGRPTLDDSESGMEGELLVGDAIDDITDIAIDLAEVAWLAEHATEADAMWQFHFGFRSHWGSHLRFLQGYLRELSAVGSVSEESKSQGPPDT